MIHTPAQASLGLFFVCVLAACHCSKQQAVSLQTNPKPDKSFGLEDESSESKIDGAEVPWFHPRLAVSHGRICAIPPGGEVWCWGANPEGQNEWNKPQKVVSQPEAKFNQVALIGDRACAVSGVNLHCVGNNSEGQLGFKGPDQCKVGPLRNGKVFHEDCSEKLLAVPNTKANLVTVSTWSICALETTDEVACWGRKQKKGMRTELAQEPWRVSGFHGARKLLSSAGFSCALESEGRIACWGRNRQEQLSPGKADDEVHYRPKTIELSGKAKDFALGRTHGCALVDQEVHCWGGVPNSDCGDANCPAIVKVLGLESLHLRSLASGGGTDCALTVEGEAYCWGNNWHDWLGITDEDIEEDVLDPWYEMLKRPHKLAVPPLRELSIGSDGRLACGVTKLGEVWCWGYSYEKGVLGVATDVECDGGCIEPPTQVKGIQL